MCILEKIKSQLLSLFSLCMELAVMKDNLSINGA